MPTKRPISFTEAKRQYVNRFTMEHIPQWARAPHYHTIAKAYVHYAPAYATDREWYDATLFEGESELADNGHCYSSGQTWPLGKGFLKEPFHLNRNQRAFDPAAEAESV